MGRGFAIATLGRADSRASPNRLSITQVLGEHAAQSRFAAVHSAALTPFIGREQEIGPVLDRWQMARDGDGQATPARMTSPWLSEPEQLRLDLRR